MAIPKRGKADALIGRIESAHGLDAPSFAVRTAMARPMQIAGAPSQRVRNFLNGTWYGHPTHPMLVTIPIGTWTLALGLDLLGALRLIRRDVARGADTALRAGAVAAVAAAAAGLMDWQHTEGRDRRVGLVHAGVNSAALALNLRSIALRRRGARGRGRAVSAAAWACMALGGYLGGHLVYRRRIGVEHADRSPAPRGFQPVLPVTELQDNRPVRAEVWDENLRQYIGVAVVLREGEVFALGARCAHAGGPLDEGWLLNGELVCPWHGSRFDLATGQPLAGPSTCPQPRYIVRIREGMVEVKREQEPGDEIVTPDSLAAFEAASPGPADAPAGKTAIEVLIEHHEFLRGLLAKIRSMPRSDPERRDVMRTLATELEIHEHIEDRIFYPAVEPVSEDVQVAHSEHATLGNLLAMTLKYNTASPEFDEHLRALNEALNHHAGSEERSMFPQSRRLGEARLRHLGARLGAMLEHERDSRFRQAFYRLKVGLLEG